MKRPFFNKILADIIDEEMKRVPFASPAWSFLRSLLTTHKKGDIVDSAGIYDNHAAGLITVSATLIRVGAIRFVHVVKSRTDENEKIRAYRSWSKIPAKYKNRHYSKSVGYRIAK